MKSDVNKKNKRKYYLTAYLLGGQALPLKKAGKLRPWMEQTPKRSAFRCLPLLMANQAGWMILNKNEFRAKWDGGMQRSSIKIQTTEGEAPCGVYSHFGSGVLSWHPGCLFVTSPGFNLRVRGPVNWPKDGIYALEGIVETDWAPMTFTMNWKFTRRNQWVYWGKGEPFCMLLPERRHQLEQFRVEGRPLSDEPKLGAAHVKWMKHRAAFLKASSSGKLKEPEKLWQKHYFSGKNMEGVQFADHQTNLNLCDFAPGAHGGEASARCPVLAHAQT
jgi:hypothetical protein